MFIRKIFLSWHGIWQKYHFLNDIFKNNNIFKRKFLLFLLIYLIIYIYVNENIKLKIILLLFIILSYHNHKNGFYRARKNYFLSN